MYKIFAQEEDKREQAREQAGNAIGLILLGSLLLFVVSYIGKESFKASMQVDTTGNVSYFRSIWYLLHCGIVLGIVTICCMSWDQKHSLLTKIVDNWKIVLSLFIIYIILFFVRFFWFFVFVGLVFFIASKFKK